MVMSVRAKSLTALISELADKAEEDVSGRFGARVPGTFRRSDFHGSSQ